MKRFQRIYGTPNVEFAAYLPFYGGYCETSFLEDNEVSDRPIRMFQGEKDDFNLAEPCRKYVDNPSSSVSKAELVRNEKSKSLAPRFPSQRQGVATLPRFKLASNPEYCLCGRSLRTALPKACLCPTNTSCLLTLVIPV